MSDHRGEVSREAVTADGASQPAGPYSHGIRSGDRSDPRIPHRQRTRQDRAVRRRLPRHLRRGSRASHDDERCAALDPHLRQAWRDEVSGDGARALESSKAGGKGVAGPNEVLIALSEGRVEHLLLDPYLEADEAGLDDASRAAIEEAGEASVQEAMVELALRTNARVSSASVEEVPALGEAGGAIATLRY